MRTYAMPHEPITLTLVLDAATAGRFFDLIKAAVVSATPPAESSRAAASRRAVFAGEEPPEDEKLLIDTRETAKLLNVSEKTVFNMKTKGRMPAPICIGRAVRWRRRELEAWINASCPTQENWTWPLLSK
jgi:excisionase family DNA binding protein